MDEIITALYRRWLPRRVPGCLLHQTENHHIIMYCGELYLLLRPLDQDRLELSVTDMQGICANTTKAAFLVELADPGCVARLEQQLIRYRAVLPQQ